MMRINLRQTTSMKRHLVYTTDDLRARPFDATHYFASTPHENCYLTAPVEKVGLSDFEPPIAQRACAYIRNLTGKIAEPSQTHDDDRDGSGGGTTGGLPP